MADPRFFQKNDAVSLNDLAEIVQCPLGAGVDGARLVSDVAPLQTAGADDVSFLDNARYKEAFFVSKAGVCIVSEAMAKHAPDGMICLISASPYRSYALAAQYFYPASQEEMISPQAHVDPSANIGIGCVIEAGAVIGSNVEIGDHCRIGANAVISHALIGAHVSIYRGACIGQDGFGFAIDPKGFVKVPQLGRVVIGDHVEIGANTTIDRGAGPDTVIGQGTWIDNLVQIGHNVQIGKGCVIVSQVGISGSTVLEDYVMIGGQGGLAGHLHIGTGAQIAAQSGVMRDIPAGESHMGSPSMPIKQFMRQVAILKRMLKKGK